MKCAECESEAVRFIPKKRMYICYKCGASWYRELSLGGEKL